MTVLWQVKAVSLAASAMVLLGGMTTALATQCTRSGCSALATTATTTIRPTTTPQTPLPGPIAEVKWRYSPKYGLLRVYWRTSSDATSYRVRLTRMRLIVVRDSGKTKKHFTPRPAPWVDTSVKRYRIEGVKPGARYAVSVRGVNSAGTGPVANARFTAE